MNTSHSYVSWGAVLAGTVVAVAISAVLLQFGSAVGLAAVTDLDPDTAVTAWGVLVVAVWLLWVQLTASIIGGYIAGRLRQPFQGATPHEAEVRDGAHGLLVWASGTVAVTAAAALAAAIAALAPDMAADPAIVQTPEILENEKALSILYAFAAGSTSLVSAVAAWFAATKGGDHRDSQVDLSKNLSFRA